MNEEDEVPIEPLEAPISGSAAPSATSRVSDSSASKRSNTVSASFLPSLAVRACSCH